MTDTDTTELRCALQEEEALIAAALKTAQLPSIDADVLARRVVIRLSKATPARRWTVPRWLKRVAVIVVCASLVVYAVSVVGRVVDSWDDSPDAQLARGSRDGDRRWTFGGEVSESKEDEMKLGSSALASAALSVAAMAMVGPETETVSVESPRLQAVDYAYTQALNSMLEWPEAYAEDYNRRAGECLPTGAVQPDLTLEFSVSPSAERMFGLDVDFMVTSIGLADASAIRYDPMSGLMFFVR